MGIAIGSGRTMEYDLEAAQIARLTIERAQSAADVRLIVDRVFGSYFWPGSGTHLELVADDVWQAYGALLARRAIKEPSRRALEPTALDHVRSFLWLAGAFGPALDRQLQLAVWRAWTYADRDVSPQRLANYAVGGHVFTGGSVSEQIGRIVRGRLRRRGVWIVPDALAKPADASLREIPHDTVDDTVATTSRRATRPRDSAPPGTMLLRLPVRSDSSAPPSSALPRIDARSVPSPPRSTSSCLRHTTATVRSTSSEIDRSHAVPESTSDK